MDNKTALAIAVILVGILAADIFYFEWGLLVIIGKLLAEASDWIAFWRDI